MYTLLDDSLNYHKHIIDALFIQGCSLFNRHLEEGAEIVAEY